MIARNLREAHRFTRPDPLMPGDPRYVDRVQSIRQMLTSLQVHLANGELPKLILSGTRGSGKTTELFRVSEILSQLGNMVVHIQASDLLDLLKPQVEDLILAIAQELLFLSRASGLRIEENLTEGILSWFREAASTEATLMEATAGLGGLGILKRLVGEVKVFQPRREDVRRIVRTSLSDLVSRLNDIFADIEIKSDKPIVLIVDDLDRIDLLSAHMIFHDNASVLTQLHCGAVFTVPISLLYSPAMPAIQALYDGWFTVPVTKVANFDGTPNEKGKSILREMVLRRMSSELISPEALELAIAYSGGLPRDLLRLVNESLIFALSAGVHRVEIHSMSKAVTKFARDFERIISQSEILRLRRIRETKRIQSQDDVSFVEYSIALEYQNGEVWWDIHPLALRVLEY